MVDQVASALPTQLDEFANEKALQEALSFCLKRAADKGMTQAETALSVSVGLEVAVRQQAVEHLEFQRDNSLSLTVYSGQKRGSASTSDLSKNSLESVVEAACAIAKMTEADPFAGLAEANQQASVFTDCDLYHPWDVSVDDAVEIAKAMEAVGLADPCIQQSEGANVSTGQSYYAYANSNGFMGGYPSSRHSMSALFLASQDGNMERDYAYDTSRYAEKLETPEDIGERARFKTLRRLGARKLKTQKCPVIFDREIATNYWSHFFSGISGGAQYRKSTCLLGCLGEDIFPEFVTLRQSPFLAGAMGSGPFDQDGLLPRDIAFVENGRVQDYVMNTYTARQCQRASTANAGGLFNIRVPSHNAEAIQSLEKGLLVTQMMGQGVNLITGDYSRGAVGFWVEKGQIQYPVHEITVSGNLRDMFRQLVAIGDDVDPRRTVQTGSLLIEEISIAGS